MRRLISYRIGLANRVIRLSTRLGSGHCGLQGLPAREKALGGSRVPRQVVGQSKSRILFADDGSAAATKSSIRSVSYLKETSPSQPATNRFRFVSALCQQNPRTRTPSPIAAAVRGLSSIILARPAAK